MSVRWDCSCTQSPDHIELSNAWISLVLNARTGKWEELTYRPMNQPLLVADQPRPALEVGVNQAWLPASIGWQVEQIDCRVDEQGAHCSLLLKCAEIEVWDIYQLFPNQPLIARKARVVYRGGEKKTFWGVLFRLPPLSLGDVDECEVLVPGQSTLSRIPLSKQVVYDQYPQPLDDLKDRQGIGRTPFGPLESALDFTPGVIGIHHGQKKISVLSWFHPQEDVVTLATEGYPHALGVTHHHRVEGWADVDREYACGTQYLAVQAGEIADAFGFIQTSWSWLAGLQAYSQNGNSPVCGDTLVYETSAKMEGGISRLTEKLPALRQMGVNLIYLLPVWLGVPVTPEVFAADRPLNYRLDPGWQQQRVPHRIISHEALDPAVGAKEEIRQFVARAHTLQMRVLFDLVFHGVAPGSPLLAEKPAWFQRDLHGEMFASHEWIPSYSLDWANPEVIDYFLKFALSNVEEFDIDGYRIDAPFQKESNWREGLAWRSGASGFGGVRFLRALRQELQATKPGSVLLCEHSGPVWDSFCDVCNDDAFLRMCLKVAQAGMQAAELQAWLYDRTAVNMPGSMRILSIENHNSTRVNPSSLAYRGSPIARALFTICCFSGGVPLVWSGQETGQETFYRTLTQLRRDHPALQHGRVNLQAHADSADIFIVLRTCREENLAVVVNCGPRWDRVAIKIPPSARFSKVCCVWNNAGGLAVDEVYVAERPGFDCTVGPYATYLLQLE